jgi:hypothetical protein
LQGRGLVRLDIRTSRISSAHFAMEICNMPSPLFTGISPMMQNLPILQRLAGFILPCQLMFFSAAHSLTFEGLIRDDVREDKTIEYKREIPRDRTELLKDVSAFALVVASFPSGVRPCIDTSLNR